MRKPGSQHTTRTTTPLNDRAMTYREFFSHVVDVVEALGATIMVVGGLAAEVGLLRDLYRAGA